jgi:hypothetical protein
VSDLRGLREKARDILRAGKLPDRAPDHMWGGLGTGTQCVVCGVATTPGETELEIEYRRDDRGRADSYVVHPLCYSLVEEERLSAAPGPRRHTSDHERSSS